MTGRPLVSVVVPAYQAASTIDATLRSALAQTWRPLEVVVVDDGSRDGTSDVARRHGVRLIRQENRGPSAAQNTALREAQGEFIQFLDADDLLSPDKVERQLLRLRDRPGAIAWGEWARFRGAPEEARFVPDPVSADLAPEEWLVQAWAGGQPMMQPGIWLVPRSVIDRAGPWDERLSLINDLEYFTRVLLAADQVLPCPGARLYYRSGNPSSVASTRSPAAWRSALTSLELATAALLERRHDEAARRACADLFQEWRFGAELEAPPDVVEKVEARLRLLGGSSVRMQGGPALRALDRLIGWRAARRVQRWTRELTPLMRPYRALVRRMEGLEGS